MSSLQERRAARRKTWSRMGDLGRVPTEYEIVTHEMVHTAKEIPLEMGAETFPNQWMKRYRDETGLKVTDWEAFRDPDAMTYRLYNQQQDRAESFVDQAIEQYTERTNGDAGLDNRCVQLLARVLAPSRYMVHGLQMASAYVQQMASTAYVANAAAFQAADQLRRVERTAYRTRQLSLARPDAGFGTGERAIWEQDALWQPVRRAVEELLVLFAWHDAFVATNLLVKPALDLLSLQEFRAVAEENGDTLDALISANLFEDAERSMRWSVALSCFLIEQDEANRQLLTSTARTHRPKVRAAVESFATLLGEYSERDAETIRSSVEAGLAKLLADAGLAGAIDD
ncbi:MAG: toluene hydroxylase [Gammaproteobacteria bacterium]|nr:toluene hydroxylase [Gammaproteobacteria bacterium]